MAGTQGFAPSFDMKETKEALVLPPAGKMRGLTLGGTGDS